MIVGERLVAQPRNRRQPARVGEEHQKYRSIRDPRHVGDQRGDRALLGLVAHHHDIGLLQIALRGRRKRAGAQQAHELRLDRTRQEAPVHAMAGDPRQLVQSPEIGIDRTRLAEPFGERILDQLGGCLRRGVLLHGSAPGALGARSRHRVSIDQPRNSKILLR
jgi:hypothetical protein